MGMSEKLKTFYKLYRDKDYLGLGYSLANNFPSLFYKTNLDWLLLKKVANGCDFLSLSCNGHNVIITHFLNALGVKRVMVHSSLKENAYNIFLRSVIRSLFTLYECKGNKIGFDCHRIDYYKETKYRSISPALLKNAFSKKLPFIIQTRDPICMLAWIINDKAHTLEQSGSLSWSKEQIEEVASSLCFSQDYNVLGDNEDIYRPSIEMSIKNTIAQREKHSQMSYCFINTFFEDIKDLMDKILFIDYEELKHDRIIETLKRVVSYLKITVAEGNYHNPIILQGIDKPYFVLLTYIVSYEYGEGNSGEMALMSDDLLSAKPFFSYTELPKELTKDFIASRSPNFHFILTGQNQKENLTYLSNNPTQLKALIEHFNVYYKATQKRLEALSQYNITEEDILAYFKDNEEIYKEFRDYIDYEIGVVKQYAPHIVESWKYYQKFLAISP